MKHEKGDLNYSFESLCSYHFFEESLEWNHETGRYADPRTQRFFMIFCEGYNAAHKGL